MTDGPGGLPIDPTSPRTIAIAFVAVVGLALLVGGATGTAAFGSHNPSWDGSSDLRTIAEDGGTDVVLAEQTTAYESVDPNETVAMVIRPGEYDDEDLDRIREFVENGGTLVVAARDPAVTNPMIDAIGGSVQVDGAPLRDDREHDAGPALPVVTTVANHSYVAGAEGFTLNHGTALEPNDATTLASSSEFSYLDRAGVGEPTEEQPLGAQPVIALEPVGDGEIVAVSDPSVFINVMLEREGNRNVAAALFEAHETALFDQSTRGVPPLVSLQLAIDGSPAVAITLGTLLFGAVLAWQRRVPRRLFGDADRRHRETDPSTLRQLVDEQAELSSPSDDATADRDRQQEL